MRCRRLLEIKSQFLLQFSENLWSLCELMVDISCGLSQYEHRKGHLLLYLWKNRDKTRDLKVHRGKLVAQENDL